MGISTPIDKIPRYLLHSRKNVILYWRGLPISNASNALGRRMQRASKRRIYFVGLCDCVRAAPENGHAKQHIYTRTCKWKHANEKHREFKSAEKITKRDWTSTPADKFFSSAIGTIDCVRRLRYARFDGGKRKAEIGLSRCSMQRVTADEYADAHGIENLL